MNKADVDFGKIPDSPGVYYFIKSGVIEYVGKATSLRSRVRSYFDPDLHVKRSELVAKVVGEATTVKFEETDSVLEALLLEARKIKELKPVGNSASKDDKSFNYVVITREEFPRVLTYRGRELSTAIAPALIYKLYGPFTQGSSLKEALKIIRRIFPFFDTKFPISGHPMSRGHRMSSSQEKHVRFNQSIGKYPSDTDEVGYRKSIRNIVYLFEGKKKSLLTMLGREMRALAKVEKFEEAEVLKRQVFALTHIQDIALIKDEYRDTGATEYRIEAFDTAHLGGAAARGVMAVVVDGQAETSQYRTFTIRTAKGADDYQALRELLERRFNHPEWAFPKLVVIDGGATHLKVARATLARLNLDIETVAVVKDERHKPREILGKKSTAENHKTSIILANQEAHRFSIGRHRKAMRKRVQ